MSEETKEMMKPLSIQEVRELLTSTLHGAPPHKTLMRIFATLAVLSSLVEENDRVFEAVIGLHESLKHAHRGSEMMIQQIERKHYNVLLETAKLAKSAMSELLRVTDELLKTRRKING